MGQVLHGTGWRLRRAVAGDVCLDGGGIGGKHAETAWQLFDAFEFRRPVWGAAQRFLDRGSELDGQCRFQDDHRYAGLQVLAGYGIARVRAVLDAAWARLAAK